MNDLKQNEIEDLLNFYAQLCTDQVLYALLDGGLIRESAIHTQDMFGKQGTEFWIGYLTNVLKGDYDKAETSYKAFFGTKTRTGRKRPNRMRIAS